MSRYAIPLQYLGKGRPPVLLTAEQNNNIFITKGTHLSILCHLHGLHQFTDFLCYKMSLQLFFTDTVMISFFIRLDLLPQSFLCLIQEQYLSLAVGGLWIIRPTV